MRVQHIWLQISAVSLKSQLVYFECQIIDALRAHTKVLTPVSNLACCAFVSFEKKIGYRTCHGHK